ncbi:flagellin [Methylobacterium sp. Leaf123]|uniref:flagellin N-terminal helical domain-containing protein n=1 Tax=Methylobacterium sp. Leaf123 TaxID=1736264 RepID=UPI0006FBF1F2|nr:flagellin [Methylobacterium sp. Leaf123]KQQ13643.1 flagellin [Methylobacterium sp. Leaf123]
MTSLSTNTAALTALGTLKGITAQLATTGNRLATGQRISTASDSAAYWSIATAIRTDNASLRAVVDTLGLGAAAFDVAYAGIDGVLSDLRTLRATLQTALTTGVDRPKIQTEVAAIQARMRATADTSVSAGRNWLSVDSGSATYRASEDIVAGFSRAPSGTVGFSTFPVDIEALKLYDASATFVRIEPTPATITGPLPLAMSPAFASNGRADFTGPLEVSLRVTTEDGSNDIRVNGTTLASRVTDLAAVTPAELTEAIEAQIASWGGTGNVTAALTADGRLSFATTATGAAASLSLQAVQPSVGHVSADLAVAPAPDLRFSRPFATATNAYQNIDLSGTNSKSVTLGDGTSSVTFTFDANSQPPPADLTSVTFHEMAWMFWRHADNRTDVGFSMWAQYDGSQSRFSASNSLEGPSAHVTVGGPDAAAFGFTPGQSAVGGEYFVSSRPSSAVGRDGSPPVPVRGLLDTAGASGHAIATLDVSDMTGPLGDATLLDVIRDVETAIGSVTDAGTRLGAGKTLVEGQRMFLDALVKTNERAIGVLVDADIETEVSKLKALQTQRELAVQGLSIANASSRTLLSLFA